MIEIRNLHKAFGDREVLKGITSTFDSGRKKLGFVRYFEMKIVFLPSI